MDQRQQLQRLLLQRLESLQHAGVLDLPRCARVPPVTDAAVTVPSAVSATVLPVAVLPVASATVLPVASATVLPVASATVLPVASATAAQPAPTAAPPVVASAPPSLFTADRNMATPATRSRDQRIEALNEVCREVAQCQRCAELAATRTQTVFGVGNPQARLVFLGEAPGADEDRQGEPFVGRAGQLLNKIIEACTLRREDVYILNILRCRPPDNRTPAPQEAANCRDFLLRQLEIIQPEFICCLGAVAAQNLLETTKPIGQLRGRFHRFQHIQVMATYHPAYLLRNPNAKRATWDDMKMLMGEMGIRIPEK